MTLNTTPQALKTPRRTTLRIATLAAAFCVATALAAPAASAATAEERKADLNAQLIGQPTAPHTMPVFAQRGDTTNMVKRVGDYVAEIPRKETSNFEIVQLIRVLFLAERNAANPEAHRTYESMMLPSLKTARYWLTRNEPQWVYSTENHQISWMSSGYLMRQRYGLTMDSALDVRLERFLRNKDRYGYYEFFSGQYHEETLTSLLNLVDFANDPKIASLAEAAAAQLMNDMLMVTNDQGYFFPPAGRNSVDRQRSGGQTASWIRVATGKHDPSATAYPNDLSSGFIATTRMDLQPIGDQWTETLQTRWDIGHKIGDPAPYEGLNQFDRGLFKMSAQAFCHRDAAADTAYTALKANMFRIKGLTSIPDLLVNAAATFGPAVGTIGAPFCDSGEVASRVVDVYKNRSTVLSSTRRRYPGKFGFQTWPWGASIGDVGVFTQGGYSGKTSASVYNVHLPSVKQDGNVALITYRPNALLVGAGLIKEVQPALGGPGWERVSLHWPATKMNGGTATYGQWVMGSNDDSYIAVYRDDTKAERAGVYSDRNGGRQTWAVIVGNSDTHGSFAAFQSVVKAAKVESSFTWWTGRYASSITADGKSISDTL